MHVSKPVNKATLLAAIRAATADPEIATTAVRAAAAD
jgi:hypothetical protein